MEKIPLNRIESDLEGMTLNTAYQEVLQHVRQAAAEKDPAEAAALEEKLRRIESGNPETLEDRKRALVMEHIFQEQIKRSGWLGDQAEATPASAADGKRGIDVVVKFGRNEEGVETLQANYLGLAIDVTFGGKLARQFSEIKEDMDELSEKGGEHMPRVIVAGQRKTVQELIELWLSKDPEDKEKLSKHWLQMQFIEQIKGQLIAFELYARKNNNDGKTADTYASILRIIEALHAEKKKAFPANIQKQFDGEWRNFIMGLVEANYNLAA